MKIDVEKHRKNMILFREMYNMLDEIATENFASAEIVLDNIGSDETALKIWLDANRKAEGELELTKKYFSKAILAEYL